MSQDSSVRRTADPVCVAGAHGVDAGSFLTAEQASRFLGGIHPRTLTRWAREGLIPAYPLGEGKRRLWRFRRDDLRTWMLARRSGPSLLASSSDERTLGTATDASGRRMIQ
jgi:excisionase family DNA binding protein